MQPSKVFTDVLDSSVQVTGIDGTQVSAQITSMSFDDPGERCVTAAEDETFVLFDARKGK